MSRQIQLNRQPAPAGHSQAATTAALGGVVRASAAREARTERRLLVALALTAMIVLVEAAGGFFANSLALLSDAGHVLTDLFALGLTWFALRQARRPADARRTFGYHRVGILAAL